MKKTFLGRLLLKTVSCVSTLALILSVLICAVPTALAEDAPDIWDGSTDVSNVEYDGGDGSADTPYLISNGAQLYKMVSENSLYSTNKNTTVGIYYTSATHTTVYFKLTKDIYLNDVVNQDIEDIENPNLWYAHTSTGLIGFVDDFDGDGHTIYGLYVNTTNHGGLFYSITNANIRNLTISKSYISSSDSTNGRSGAIAGAVVSGANTKITNCYVDETVKIKGGRIAGGIVGRIATTVNISNCASLAEVTSDNVYVGGIIGTDVNSTSVSVTLENCWTNNAALRYINGTNGKFTITNCYSITDAYSIKGLNAIGNMPKLDWENTWEVTAGYPKLRTEAGAAAENPYWDGTAAESYESGTGTADDPFIIANAAQLYKMVSENYTDDGNEYYFKLKNDIYINDVTDPDWISNSPTNWYAGTSSYYFNDHLDGNGYTVYGLYFTSSSAVRGGLFPQLSDGATVKNLHITNAYINGKAGRSGVIAGKIYAAGDKKRVAIENCSVVNTTVIDSYSAAGILACFEGASVDINNCYFIGGVYNTATGSNANMYGGIVGDGWSANCAITNCYSIGAYVNSGNTTHTSCYTYSNVYTSVATAPNSSAAVTGITTLDIAKMQGANAKTYVKGFNWNTVWKVGSDGELPTLYNPSFAADYWDGTTAEGYADGSGTADDPYIISTAAELSLLTSSGEEATAGKYYKLANDIKIARVHDDWETDNATMWTRSKESGLGFNSYDDSFCGYFDGDGHTVSGIWYQLKTSASRAFGLFPVVGKNAVIKNVNIDGVYAAVSSVADDDNTDSHSNYTGAVAGYASVVAADSGSPMSWPQISGCTVTNAEIKSRYAGGIVGGTTSGVKINACSFDGTASGYTLSSAETDIIGGGIIGNNASLTVISDCYTTAAALCGVSENASVYKSAAGTTEGLDQNVWSITDSKATLKDIEIVNINADNLTADSLVKIRTALLTDSIYVADTNASAGLNILDLIHAKKSFFELAADAYVLTWSDEFNGDTLDSNVWTMDARMGTGGDLTTNWDNASVENGNFTMLSTYEDGTYAVPNTFTTMGNMSFRYGKLEMRAKVPFGAGAFPSFWLATKDALGGDENPVYTAEIDIFEVMASSGSSDKVLANAHKHYKTATVDGEEITVDLHIQYNHITSDDLYAVISDTESYHIFTFEWTPDSITVAVDGIEYMKLDLNINFDGSEYSSQYGSTDMSQFHKPMSIMINNHMFTPENSQSKYTYTGTEEIETPMEYDIDYIRLYQKASYGSLLYTD